MTDINYDFHLKTQRAELLAKLRSKGVTKVTAEYSGSGDEGQIQDISHAEAEDLFYGLLSSAYGGWENNDGGQGNFNWDIITDVINLDHGANCLETFWDSKAF